jgi:hypothetical protein
LTFSEKIIFEVGKDGHAVLHFQKIYQILVTYIKAGRQHYALVLAIKVLFQHSQCPPQLAHQIIKLSAIILFFKNIFFEEIWLLDARIKILIILNTNLF